MIKENKLNFKQKYELGTELLNFYLPYRSDIKFPNDVTFGFEIEFCKGRCTQLKEELLDNKLDNWKLVFEPTVSLFDKFGNIRGGEVISPILSCSNANFEDLKKVLELIKFCLGDVNEKTAGHIHIGSQIFENKKNLNKFLLLWAVFEDVIKRFFQGEFLDNKINKKYANLCAEDFYNSNFNIDKLLIDRNNLKKQEKSYAVSFHYFTSFDMKEKNTIEFRDIKGTLEEEIWQNNINFLIHFINFCKAINDSDIEKIKEKFVLQGLLLDYDCINFDKALFLSDNIFDNEKDKLCFLKQYFKDFYLYDKEKEKVSLIRKK